MLHCVIHVCGFSICGFRRYKKQWCPEIGQRLDCVLSKTGAVTVMKEKSLQCGTVPTELKKVSKNFLKAGGTITAEVKKDVPVMGERIPCKYIWCGPETELLKNEVKAAREVVAELRKKFNDKRISFRKINNTTNNKAGTSYETQSTDMAKGSGGNISSTKASEQAGTSYETQSTDMAKGSGGNMSSTKASEQVKQTLKRQSDERAGGSEEKLPKKKKKQSVEKKHVPKTEKLPTTEHLSETGNGLKKVKKTGPSYERQSTDMADGSGENMSSTKACKQVKKTLKRPSGEKACASEEKLQKTENIQSVKNKQVPKTKKVPTSKHLLQTGNGIKKAKKTTAQKNEPKGKKLPQALASGNQAGPSYERQSTDMADGSGENMSSTKAYEQAGTSYETQSTDMAKGSGGNMSCTKAKKTLKRSSGERAGASEEKLPKTENIQSVKNKPVPKTKKVPTSKHLLQTGNGIKKAKKTTAQKNQPKGKQLPQPLASGNQRPVQKGVNVEVDQRDKEGDNLDSEHSELEFNFVSSESIQPSGSFCDPHGQVEFALESDAKSLISRSICKIFYPTVKGNATATGFRVGCRYVMTAMHVTKEFLEGFNFAKEKYVIFNYKHDGISEEKDKYLINQVVYENKETDIAVIELLGDPSTMPPQVTLFDKPIHGRAFHLIGHSQGNPMEINLVTKLIDLNDQGNKLLFNQLQGRSLKHTKGTGYDSPPYDSIYNPSRFLFQCKFAKGASGSPGIVLIGKNVYVITVLLHGYPDWYHDPKMEIYKSDWLDKHRVQQGVNPMSVCEMMRATHPDLCQDIFGAQGL